MTLSQKNCSRVKTPSSKSLILVSFCWKKNVLLINALTNFDLVSDFFEISDRIGVAFFLGHPVYNVCTALSSLWCSTVQMCRQTITEDYSVIP